MKMEELNNFMKETYETDRKIMKVSTKNGFKPLRKMTLKEKVEMANEILESCHMRKIRTIKDKGKVVLKL